MEHECADNVGGAVDQVDRVGLLELVGADGEGLLEEGGDHEQEDLVALQAAGGEAGVSHGKEEGDDLVVGEAVQPRQVVAIKGTNVNLWKIQRKLVQAQLSFSRFRNVPLRNLS